jgi:uncharacterized Zn finger protein
MPEATTEGEEQRMYYGYGGFPEYVPVATRRAQAQRKLAQLRKQGRKVSPVVIEGRLIATTFWGKAWCENLDAYSDFSNRLPRGRTYVRNGSVIDLQIEEGRVSALVSGSEIYESAVSIRPLSKERWKALVHECAGGIDSVVELLSGRLSNAVMQVLCKKEKGIFPPSKEVSLECSCPDGASLCKHLAAVLYGVGARLDHEPELLFVLRGVDKMDLIGEAGNQGGLAPKRKAKNALSAESLSDIFGIELGDAPAPKRAGLTSRPPKRSSEAKKPTGGSRVKPKRAQARSNRRPSPSVRPV